MFVLSDLLFFFCSCQIGLNATIELIVFFCFFWYLPLLRYISREAKWEREVGRIGKGPQAGTRTWLAQSATALHIRALPTRPLAPMTVIFLS